MATRLTSLQVFNSMWAGQALFWLFFTLFWLGVYAAPTLIAYTRKHRNIASIIVINLLLGWTMLGWIVALAWAFSKDVRTQPISEGL